MSSDAQVRQIKSYLTQAVGDEAIARLLVNEIHETADTLIATAAVKTLNATPVELVAAPGSGKYLEFLGALLFIDYTSADYVAGAGEDLVIRYENASGQICSASVDGSVLAASADALVYIPPVSDPSASPAGFVVPDNKALVAHILTGEIATGDSPFKIRTFYRTLHKSDFEAIA